ncbi:MAG: response regulator, partial [Candidatus Rokubacteria bacterium]|nr:response regulator [Candidatus Rokubacteria bacterium]
MLEILVVDDEMDICWALEKGLVDEGVHITQAHRGEDAIQAVRGRSFDVAIIDVKLPGKSGIEVSRAIRELAPRLPIVMISGYHYEEDQPIQEGMRRGEYQGFISKPFELDEVSTLLRRILREGEDSPSSPHPTPSPLSSPPEGER